MGMSLLFAFATFQSSFLVKVFILIDIMEEGKRRKVKLQWNRRAHEKEMREKGQKSVWVMGRRVKDDTSALLLSPLLGLITQQELK